MDKQENRGSNQNRIPLQDARLHQMEYLWCKLLSLWWLSSKWDIHQLSGYSDTIVHKVACHLLLFQLKIWKSTEWFRCSVRWWHLAARFRRSCHYSRFSLYLKCLFSLSELSWSSSICLVFAEFTLGILVAYTCERRWMNCMIHWNMSLLYHPISWNQGPTQTAECNSTEIIAVMNATLAVTMEIKAWKTHAWTRSNPWPLRYWCCCSGASFELCSNKRTESSFRGIFSILLCFVQTKC